MSANEVGTAAVEPAADAAPPAASDSVLARVRSRLPEFTGALQRVAELVLTDPASAARSTIVELAERSGTSPATITRFCRALGFEGYSDLRLGIASETGRAARSGGWTDDIGREIQPTDPLERVLGAEMGAICGHLHTDNGTDLRLSAGVSAFQAENAQAMREEPRRHRPRPAANCLQPPRPCEDRKKMCSKELSSAPPSRNQTRQAPASRQGPQAGPSFSSSHASRL